MRLLTLLTLLHHLPGECAPSAPVSKIRQAMETMLLNQPSNIRQAFQSDGAYLRDHQTRDLHLERTGETLALDESKYQPPIIIDGKLVEDGRDG